jgi:hypothetical protein
VAQGVDTRQTMKRWLCSRGVLLGLVLAGVSSIAPVATAQPGSRAHPGRAGYINPSADPSWQVSPPTVDWVPLRRLPVLAIGDAVILGSDSHSGWPGGHLIWYGLLNGSHAGDVVYVAERLAHLIPAGRVVHAGAKIAVGIPGYPYTEWGWATQHGSPRAYPCYREGERQLG